MTRAVRLTILILVALIAGVLAIFLTSWAVSTMRQDPTAQATVVAGAITVLGIIFSAMYGEISSYYTERSTNIEKKWDLILPLLKKHYYPWINSAKSLRDAISTAMNAKKTNDEIVERLLYLTMVFYGYRLAFIMDPEAGGLILLSTSKEEDEVYESYREIERKFQWADIETPKRVSDLQQRWKTKNKSEASYVLQVFTNDLRKDKKLQDSKAKLALWLTKENMKGLDQALGAFITLFKNDIDKLYTTWGG